MKKKSLFLSVLLSSLIFVMCSSPKQEYIDRINELEEKLFADETSRIDMNTANDLINAYLAYADDFPKEDDTPDYLFKAGDMCMNLNKSQKAIQIFDRILNDYPGFEKLPQCLFLKGYVLENNLRDLDAAKKIYEEFLEKYPDDDFADDASISIQNLGKSPEELIKEFEEKSKEKEKTSI
ncbi:MAG: tetratricopeptide repeat protein [Bacteroidales bacterium]|nr:tetratricopeptide repeat protein [Bacteroidales bacterium]